MFEIHVLLSSALKSFFEIFDICFGLGYRICEGTIEGLKEVSLGREEVQHELSE